MKTSKAFLLISSITVVIVLLISCVKELDKDTYEKTVYYGKVIEQSTQKPLSGCKVQVTNGRENYPEETNTDQDGHFKISVELSKIDQDYYLSIKNGIKCVPLKGFGHGQYDFGTIEINNLPSVFTNAVSNITITTAICGGNVTASGGSDVTSRGVCWNTSGLPTIEHLHTSNGAGIGLYTSTIDNLIPNTTYYVRAYATNENGTSYGEQYSFDTQTGVASLSTTEVSAIGASTAISGGNITADGGSNITIRGVCWNTTGNPTTSDQHTEDGAGTGNFESNITGLSPSTVYYVRAYATNSIGTYYGNTQSFTTTNGIPIVTTSEMTNVTPTSLVSGGHVVSEGLSPVTARGVCWSTLPYPTTSDSHTTNGSGSGYFSSSVTGINISNTTYYIRAYATNAQGVAYGEQLVIEAGNPQGYLTVNYGGYTYVISNDMGEATWNYANSQCDNLVDVFSDWFLPDENTWVMIMQQTTDTQIPIVGSFWSSNCCSTYYGNYYRLVFYGRNSHNRYCESNGDFYYYRCIRKFQSN